MKTHFLALQDLEKFTEEEVINHLCENYSGTSSNGYDFGIITDQDKQTTIEKLKHMEVIVAYESVGDYGCDSSSFFVLRDTQTGKYFEIHGGHCSCFGFEGQLDLEETTLKALYERKDGHLFFTGGYDDFEFSNRKMVAKHIESIYLTTNN